jgi:hypothetical protein
LLLLLVVVVVVVAVAVSNDYVCIMRWYNNNGMQSDNNRDEDYNKNRSLHVRQFVVIILICCYHSCFSVTTKSRGWTLGRVECIFVFARFAAELWEKKRMNPSLPSRSIIHQFVKKEWSFFQDWRPNRDQGW